MGSSIRDKVEKAKDISTETVEVEEWGVTIEVRTMTGAAREELDDNSPSYRSEMIRLSCYDPENGQRIFGAQDIEMLDNKSALATGKLTEAIKRVNGWSAEGRDALGEGLTGEDGSGSK